MNERERIKEVISKYEDFFKMKMGADVAFSQKGDFFYYEYVEKYHNYDIFTKFCTAEELEKIILGSIAAEVECAVEELMPLSQEGIEEVDESLLEQQFDYGYFINRLFHILKILKRELNNLPIGEQEVQ